MKDKNLLPDNNTSTLEELTDQANQIIESLENEKDLNNSVESYQQLLKLNNIIEKNFHKRFLIYGSYALNKTVKWKFNDTSYYPHIIKTKKKMLTSFHDANYLTVPVAN